MCYLILKVIYSNVLKKIRSLEDFKYTLNLAAVPIKMLVRMGLGKKLSNVSVRDTKKDLHQRDY